MTAAEIIAATRAGAGLFEMSDRGLIEVRGEDRIRWLDGMISGDIEALAAGESGSGCYATLLTNRGAIIADLHVGRVGDVLVLESLRSEIPRIRETLSRFIIADDVDLTDRSDDAIVLGLEGPRAPELLQAALAAAGRAEGQGEAASRVPAPNQWCEAEIAGRAVLVSGFGFSGEPGYQLRLSAADREAVEAALDAAAVDCLEDGATLVRGDAEALEIMRIEAGLPALGRELHEEILPPEARLERAIAVNKGCYVGQEIVARLRARGQVNHLLVGLALEADALPAEGTELSAGGRVTGEITSRAESPTAGRIALGFVRREHADPDTVVEFSGGRARVVALPFVPLSAQAAPASTPASTPAAAADDSANRAGRP